MSIQVRRETSEITGGPVALIDGADSFTHNIAHAVRRLGVDCDVIPHDTTTVDELLTYRGWILGPGPCTPAASEIGLDLVRRRSSDADDRPLLGICLGHQTLAVALGGAVRRARHAVHGRRVPITHDGTGCLAGLPSPIEVTRYNSLVVDPDALPASLAVTARDGDGEIMGLRHLHRPLEGVQFHPESWLDVGAEALIATWAARLPR